MRLHTLPLLLVAFTLMALPWSVGAVSSTSYEVLPEQGFLSTHGTEATSTSYQMQGAVEAIPGFQSSSSYELEAGDGFEYFCGDGFIDPGETCDGADLDGETCSSQGFASGTLTCSSSCALVTSACNVGGGGGGGGGGGSTATAPDEPTIDDSLTEISFTYSSTLLLFGDKDSDADTITVDGSSSSVEFPTSTSWQDTVTLTYGTNEIDVIALDGSKSSATVTYEIYRRLIGDLTQDDTVDDYDLSRFVGMWGEDDREGDFNEDNTVDDYDFSMLVARWGTSV